MRRYHDTGHRYPVRWLATITTLSAALAIAGCGSNSNNDVEIADTSPKEFFFEIKEATIASSQAAMQAGTLKCTTFVESYLDRIQRLDQDLADGYPVNSVLWVNENVRQQAQALDNTLTQTGEMHGSLHCVPILLKDNYDTADMPTTAGSLTMLGSQPTADATTVARLRDAGAIILGKATMDAWAMGANGASSRPRAGSPYNRAFLTSSSSSGPAAATTASFTMAAVGSDTCNSLTGPGAVNGVVAIRSSYGMVSQNGIVPLSHSHDVAGPMARTVEDATRLLNVMAGIDSQDATTAADPSAVRYDDYTQFLDSDAATGKRIAILGSYGGNTATPDDSPEAEAVAAAIDQLRALGAEVVGPLEFENYVGTYLADYEAEDDLNGYYASHPTPLANIMALANDPLVHPNVKARVLDRIIPQIDTDDPAYAALLEDNTDGARRFEAFMDNNDLDAIVLQGGSACALSVTTGIPYMVVPIADGRTDEDPRPVGLGIMARKWDEATMLGIGYAYEQARGPRPVPTVNTALLGDVVLPALQPETYNACVENIALTARDIQGDEFRDISSDDYLSYVMQTTCTLPTHIAAGIK